jgi:hypothetical protein
MTDQWGRDEFYPDPNGERMSLISRIVNVLRGPRVDDELDDALRFDRGSRVSESKLVPHTGHDWTRRRLALGEKRGNRECNQQFFVTKG